VALVSTGENCWLPDNREDIGGIQPKSLVTPRSSLSRSRGIADQAVILRLSRF